jgi:hypothetical protein
MCAPHIPPVAEVPLVVGPKRPVTEEDVQKVRRMVDATRSGVMARRTTRYPDLGCRSMRG